MLKMIFNSLFSNEVSKLSSWLVLITYIRKKYTDMEEVDFTEEKNFQDTLEELEKYNFFQKKVATFATLFSY